MAGVVKSMESAMKSMNLEKVGIITMHIMWSLLYTAYFTVQTTSCDLLAVVTLSASAAAAVPAAFYLLLYTQAPLLQFVVDLLYN